jgi:membrane associated rhomboid family serine protease
VIFILVIYAGITLALILYRPQNRSLKDTRVIPADEWIAGIKGTLVMLALLTAVFIMTSAPGYTEAGVDSVKKLGLNWGSGFMAYQVVTSIFTHFNLLHVASNMAVLALLAVYERAAGTSRWLLIFISSAILANLFSYLYMGREVFAMGASAGICGLAAAYWCDQDKMSLKDGAKALGTVVLLVGIMSLYGAKDAGMNVDHMGHVLGALSGFAVCRLIRPWKKAEG